MYNVFEWLIITGIYKYKNENIFQLSTEDGYPLFNKIQATKVYKSIAFVDSSARRSKNTNKLEPLEMYLKSGVSIYKITVFLVYIC